MLVGLYVVGVVSRWALPTGPMLCVLPAPRTGLLRHLDHSLEDGPQRLDAPSTRISATFFIYCYCFVFSVTDPGQGA